MAIGIITVYKAGWEHWRSRVPEERSGVGSRGTNQFEARKLSRYRVFKLKADARVRVLEPLQICLGCRN